jgi:hypothetical protein
VLLEIRHHRLVFKFHPFFFPFPPSFLFYFILLPLSLYLLHSTPPFAFQFQGSLSLSQEISNNNSQKMARVLFLLALCVLPALVRAARPARNPFVVQGSVYCDTCLAGFETSKTTNIAGNHFIFRSDVSMASDFYILLNISDFI